MLERRKFNPKRRICTPEQALRTRTELGGRIALLSYGGNPQHKRNPGDFALDPPSHPRLAKTLCDSTGIFSRVVAEQLLKTAFEKGVFSVQVRDGWPQNVWAVTEDGNELEAQLDGNGSYHGYPMTVADPLRQAVRERWGKA